MVIHGQCHEHMVIVLCRSPAALIPMLKTYENNAERMQKVREELSTWSLNWNLRPWRHLSISLNCWQPLLRHGFSCNTCSTTGCGMALTWIATYTTAVAWAVGLSHIAQWHCVGTWVKVYDGMGINELTLESYESTQMPTCLTLIYNKVIGSAFTNELHREKPWILNT